MTEAEPKAETDPAAASSVSARLRSPVSRTRRVAVLAAALALVPFGSYAELQKRIVDGSIVKTVPQGRFIVGEKDDRGFISWQVADLKNAPPARLAIYLLGGSSMRECVPSPASLGNAVRARCEKRVTVKMLASSVQDYPRALAIIDNLPVARGGIVVIGVHHAQFASPSSSARQELKGIDLLMKSPALRDLVARRLGGHPVNNLREGLDVYLRDYRGKRDVEPFRGKVIAYHQHRYSSAHIWSNGAKRWRLDYWLEGKGRPGGEFDRYFSFNAACLTECVTLARARGFEVLLMECPQNAFIVKHAFDRYKKKYRPLCAGLVDSQSAHYDDINQSAGLKNTDFRDLYHLIEPGRAKWQPKLAVELAQIITDHQPGSSEPGSSPSPGDFVTRGPAPASGDGDRLMGLLESARATLSKGSASRL